MWTSAECTVSNHAQERDDHRQGYTSRLVVGETPRQRILSALGSKDCAPKEGSKDDTVNRQRIQARRRSMATTKENIDRLQREIKALEQQRLEMLQLSLVFFNFLHGTGDYKGIPKLAGVGADVSKLHRTIKQLLATNTDLVEQIKGQSGPGTVLASMVDATVRETTQREHSN